MRLKIARTILRIIAGIKTKESAPYEPKAKKDRRIIIEANNANRRFANGPARETIAESLLGLLRLYGSMITGFAQPNGITGICKTARIKTKTKRSVVPTGS